MRRARCLDAKDALTAARAIVNARYPKATAAVVGGSAASGDATAFSDLDLIVYGADLSTSRETFKAGDWLVEAFVYNEIGLQQMFEHEISRRRPVVLRICAEGVSLKDESGAARQLSTRAQRILAAGPLPLSDYENERRRYQLSALADDLQDAEDGTERFLVAGLVATQAAELALLTAGKWFGAGKWLSRLLRSQLPDLASSFDDALEQARQGSIASLLAFAHRALENAGGFLQADYRVEWSDFLADWEVRSRE